MFGLEKKLQDGIIIRQEGKEGANRNAEHLFLEVLHTLGTENTSELAIKVLLNLGILYLMLNKGGEAKDSFSKAINIAQRATDRNHKKIRLISACLAMAHLRLGDSRNAVMTLQDAIHIHVSDPHKIDRRDVAKILTKLGNACRMIGEFDYAIPALEYAFIIHAEKNENGLMNEYAKLSLHLLILAMSKSAEPCTARHTSVRSGFFPVTSVSEVSDHAVRRLRVPPGPSSLRQSEVIDMDRPEERQEQIAKSTLLNSPHL